MAESAVSEVVEQNIDSGEVKIRTASCCCGNYQIKVAGDPVRLSVCHCYACQQRTGSICGVQGRFPNSAILEVKGTPTNFTRVGDEGYHITFSFCPTCGSTVSYTFAELEGYTAITIGSFADNTIGAPTYSVYTARKHPWLQLPEHCEVCD